MWLSSLRLGNGSPLLLQVGMLCRAVRTGTRCSPSGQPGVVDGCIGNCATPAAVTAWRALQTQLGWVSCMQLDPHIDPHRHWAAGLPERCRLGTEALRQTMLTWCVPGQATATPTQAQIKE